MNKVAKLDTHPLSLIGKTVIITDKKHPHVGRRGVVVSYETVYILQKRAWRIEFEDWGSAYVFSLREMRVLGFM